MVDTTILIAPPPPPPIPEGRPQVVESRSIPAIPLESIDPDWEICAELRIIIPPPFPPPGNDPSSSHPPSPPAPPKKIPVVGPTISKDPEVC